MNNTREMMRLFLLSILLLLIALKATSQCVDSHFSVSNEDKLCKNSPINLVNESSAGDAYYWDFCPETMTESPQTTIRTLAGFEQGYGYRLVRQNQNWYGFIVSRSLDKLFRLDFGSDPQNIPTLVDLGNPGGLMDAPEAIDLFEDNGKWFGFVGKGENSTGQIVKLEFGGDLTSIPSATGYQTFGAGSVRIRDLAVARQGDDIVLLLLQYNNAMINRINFGNSLENDPGASNRVVIPGGSLPRSLDIVNDCGVMRAHVVCENGLVMQLNFGNDLTGPISVEGTFNFPSVVQPWKIRTVVSGGRYFAFISNNNRKYSIVDFGDLSLASNPAEVTSANDQRFVGMDVVKYDGKTFIQGGTGGTTLISVTYQRDCGLTRAFSYEADPKIFSYPHAGHHVVDLYADNSNSTNYLQSKSIVIEDGAAPSLLISQEGACEDNPVYFWVSEAESLASWTWNLGNSMTGSTPSVETVYSNPGTYPVVLEAVATNGCLAGGDREIKIYPAPMADFEIPGSAMCTNNEFAFLATTPDIYDGLLSYQWSLDGHDAVNTREFRVAFTTTGQKSIQLTTSIPGCENETTKYTPTIEVGPVVSFDHTGLCEDEEFSFLNETVGEVESFEWDFGNGETSTDADPRTLFLDAGDYKVTLSALTRIGCLNVHSKTLNVRSKPVVDFQVPQSPNGCSGITTVFDNHTINPDSRDITEWLWSFGDPDDPEISDESGGQHLYKTPGEFTVSLVATTAEGCSGSVAKEVTILEAPATTFLNTPLCEDLPVDFELTDGSQVRRTYWEIGTSYYTNPSPTHTFLAPGEYPVYVETEGFNGCISSRREMVRVPVPLTPDFSITQHCVGEDALLTDITSGVDPVVSRTWLFNNTDPLNDAEVTHRFESRGPANIRLTVTSESGCSYTMSRTVDIIEPPIAAFNASPSSGATPLEVMFANTSTGASQFSWSFGDGSEGVVHDVSPTHTFSSVGQYNVQLIAANEIGCKDSNNSTITTIQPLADAKIDMVNVSGNPDGTTKIIVTVQNTGNTLLKQLPLRVDVDGTLQLQQILPQTVEPGGKTNFVFSQVDIAYPSIHYVCVSLDVPDDLTPDNNRRCEQFAGELLTFPAYPNPTGGTLNIEWIAQTAGAIHISLTDLGGRRILEASHPGQAGLNSLQFDLSPLEAGLYILVIGDGRTKTIQRIAFRNRP